MPADEFPEFAACGRSVHVWRSKGLSFTGAEQRTFVDEDGRQWTCCELTWLSTGKSGRVEAVQPPRSLAQKAVKFAKALVR